MQIFIYHFFLRIYHILISIASLFNKKAQQWKDGRNATKALIKNNSLQKMSGCIWIHASSLGEFEQARPMIEKIKNTNSTKKIVVTFYSPSGYEIRKNYDLADMVMYLPYDTGTDIKLFIDQLNPSCVIWVRYEFWINTLKYIHQKNFPVYLISASFRDEQVFFKWYGDIFKNCLNYFTKIFIINDSSKKLLEEIGIKETILCPDTRMDRVQSIAHSNTQNKNIENFLVNKNCILVAGSTWQADIDILFPFINNHPEYAYIIAPHQINENTLSYIETKLTIPNIRYSLIENKESIFESVLIIDNMGMLASLYKHGKYTYVGGGFGISVHNVLEAIVYEKPVMFGPHHKKQNECSILLDRNVATIVYTSKEIEENILSMENNNSLYLEKCKGAEKYLNENIGGTDIIYEQIKNKI